MEEGEVELVGSGNQLEKIEGSACENKTDGNGGKVTVNQRGTMGQ